MSHEPNPPSSASKSGRFKTFVAWICGPIVLAGLIAVAVWAARTAVFPASVSTVRLLVGGTEMGTPIPDEFFGTNIEMIQSAEVLRGAETRVHSLHPNLELQPCSVRASRIPGTRIILIRCAAADSSYVKAYVDAVADELVAKRRDLRESARESKMVAIQDEMVRSEKELQHLREEMRVFNKEFGEMLAGGKASFDVVEDWKSLTEKRQREKLVYDDLSRQRAELNREQYTDRDTITILEHATPAARIMSRFTFLQRF